MAERVGELKSGECHLAGGRKALAVVSGVLIGGGIGIDAVFPGHGIEITSTINKSRAIFIDLASALTTLGGVSGLWGAFKTSFEDGVKAGEASSENKDV